MESSVIWSKKSDESLKRIFLFIAPDSEVYARRFVKDLILHTETLFNNKVAITGRAVPEFENTILAYLREIIYRGYRIIYDPTHEDGKIRVIIVISGRESIQKHV